MHRIIVFSAMAALAVIALASLPWAHGHRVGDIAIDRVWGRAAADSDSAAAAFMTLTNTGMTEDRLVSVATEIADVAELYAVRLEGGDILLRRVEALTMPGGATVQMQPGGLHVMLTGLRTPMPEGETFPLTLNFERAGAITIAAHVFGAAAAEPMLAAPFHAPAEAGGPPTSLTAEAR